MAYCSNCGAQMPDGAKFCTACGAKVPGQGTGDQAKNFWEKLNATPDYTDAYDPNDIVQNKGMGVLAYLSWLVLIPIFAAKKSPFARFHSNQGLILALTDLLWGILRSILYAIMPSFLDWTVTLVFGLGSLVLFAATILGIVNVANGRAKELPLLGKYRILS